MSLGNETMLRRVPLTVLLGLIIGETMREKTTIFKCENIGVSGTTDIHVVQNHDETYEARVGIALMGSTQMDDAGFAACNYDPFHENFFDNYAYGVGETEEEAINSMKRNMRKTAESLWI